MNNNYNEIALRQIGRWIDAFIEFTFEKHIWIGISLLMILAYLIIKWCHGNDTPL